MPVFQTSLFRKAEKTEEEEDRAIVLIFDPITIDDDDGITRLFLFDATVAEGPGGEGALLEDPLIGDRDGKIIICLSMTWLKDANS